MYTFKDNEKAKIKQKYNPPEQIQETRKAVYKRYTDMKNGRFVNGANLEDKWLRWEKQYESWRPPKRNWQSNIVPPFTPTIVERALAELVGQTVRPRVTGRGEEDKYKAKLINYLVDYNWMIARTDLEMEKILRNMLVLGKGIAQEDYWIDKREVQILKKLDLSKNIEEYEKKTIFDYNDLYTENVPLIDFFIDPNADSINVGKKKAKDVIRRYVIDYDMFMEAFKGSIWDQFGATEYVKPGTASDYFQFYQPPRGINGNEVELLFYWGRTFDKFVITANDVVIRDNPNPYNHKQLPFAEVSDVDRLQGFWAKGEPELLESVQDELTTLRRMRIDRQHIDIFKPTFISNREIFEEDENIVHPNAFIPLDDPSSVRFPEYSDVNPSAYREEEQLKEDGRQVTGIMNPASTGTATGDAISKEDTMKTLQKKIWKVSNQLVYELVRLKVPNMVQFYSADNVANILGEAETTKYRRIMTTNVALEVGRDGRLIEKQARGDHFFDVTPDMVTPQYGSFNLIMDAEPKLPLSKPLRQQKVKEWAESPTIASAIEVGYYDIGKVADVISEEFEFDPEKFKVDPTADPASPVDEEQLFEIANRENEIMLKGISVPGTAYAPRSHTDIHLSFMGSDQFKQVANADPRVTEAFSKHVLMEEQAQQARTSAQPQGTLGQAQNMPGSGQQSSAVMGSELKSTMPNKLVGAEQVPEGVM